MRKVGFMLGVAFVVTLAVVVGNRMSAEAMAVVVGLVCGVAAGIPMSMLLLFALNRRAGSETGQRSEQRCSERLGGYPPVVVVQGGAALPSQFAAPYYPVQAGLGEQPSREFRIVGEHDGW